MGSRAPRGRLVAALAAAAAACVLAGCGTASEQRLVSHSALEGMLVNAFPVYWVGGTFHGLSISETFHDTSGAYSLQYGACVEGSQVACVAPLRIVTSADNSFLPLGSTATSTGAIRGVQVWLARGGRTIVMPTGGVVVSIYARDRSLARAAALTAVPLNQPAAPGAPLPARLPDTGYGEHPLPTQEPTPLRPVR
ncbi:MAG TPA: hypothetical protein VFW29_08585 [Solirubrobacteraceae bacterium]|nr:hypothetical protein [Solirubrobacteraceae bacterium]